mmetsp:Transcript_31296/g.75294  ORF Transcript_31296/g.75294 Transcript_31296/m.75294 type:complete len:301 (-) Transcript_31296:172-1074(-)
MSCRHRLVAICLFLLYIITWMFSMSGEFKNRFWDKKYNLKRVEEPKEELALGFNEITKSYFSDLRYYYFVPHIVGAIFWWNLYFFQLIPKIRHNYKKFHRMLGRFLLVVLLVQNVTGFCMAATTKSHIVKFVSYLLCFASIFCVTQAWRYAYYRDIPKHKHWAIRLVGYMQTISLQRFWLGMLIVPHSMGWDGLYPLLDDDSTDNEWISMTETMFDDSFVLAILSAFLFTEWYLAAEQGMTEPAIDNRNKEQQEVQNSDATDDAEKEEIDEVDHAFNGGEMEGEMTAESDSGHNKEEVLY